MFRIVFTGLVFLFLSGCGKKELLLPLVAVDGISETQNHSSIWMFYSTTESDTLAVLNKNNKLLNTNWIYNIDRRLQMKHIIPHLEALQANREKPSVHKKEGMENFFSFANIENERISLVPFSQIVFVKHSESLDDVILNTRIKEVASGQDIPSNLNDEKDSIDNGTSSIEENKENPVNSCIVRVILFSDYFEINGKQFSWDQLDRLKPELALCRDIGVPIIHLFYDQNLLYQEYLTLKATLSAAQILIAEQEDVYSLK